MPMNAKTRLSAAWMSLGIVAAAIAPASVKMAMTIKAAALIRRIGKCALQISGAYRANARARDKQPRLCPMMKAIRPAMRLVMPDGRRDDAGERHRQHEFPGEAHDLIDARAWQRPANPDKNKKQHGELRKKPEIRWNDFEPGDRRVPAAQKERHGQAADREHPEIFRHEKRGVLESGIFRHVS